MYRTVFWTFKRQCTEPCLGHSSDNVQNHVLDIRAAMYRTVFGTFKRQCTVQPDILASQNFGTPIFWDVRWYLGDKSQTSIATVSYVISRVPLNFARSISISFQCQRTKLWDAKKDGLHGTLSQRGCVDVRLTKIGRWVFHNAHQAIIQFCQPESTCTSQTRMQELQVLLFDILVLELR